MYEAKRILEQAFPDITTERTTCFAALGHSLHTMPVSPGSAGITLVLAKTIVTHSSSHTALDRESLNNAELY